MKEPILSLELLKDTDLLSSKLTSPEKVALPVSNAKLKGVILDVEIVKLVPEAVNDGSKPPPAKLSNINFGVDFDIVTFPAKVESFVLNVIGPSVKVFEVPEPSHLVTDCPVPIPSNTDELSIFSH